MDSAISVPELEEEPELPSSTLPVDLEEEEEAKEEDKLFLETPEPEEATKGDNKFRYTATSLLSRQLYDYVKIGNHSDAIAIYHLMKKLQLHIAPSVRDRIMLVYPLDRIPELLEEAREGNTFRPYTLVGAIINYARNFQLEKAVPLIGELKETTSGVNVANAVIKTLLGHNRLDLALQFFEVLFSLTHSLAHSHTRSHIYICTVYVVLVFASIERHSHSRRISGRSIRTRSARGCTRRWWRPAGGTIA